ADVLGALERGVASPHRALRGLHRKVFAGLFHTPPPGTLGIGCDADCIQPDSHLRRSAPFQAQSAIRRPADAIAKAKFRDAERHPRGSGSVGTHAAPPCLEGGSPRKANGSLPTAQDYPAPTEDSHCSVPGRRGGGVYALIARTLAALDTFLTRRRDAS